MKSMIVVGNVWLLPCPPGTHLHLGVLKRNNYIYYESGDLVEYLADLDPDKSLLISCSLITSSPNSYCSSDLQPHLSSLFKFDTVTNWIKLA